MTSSFIGKIGKNFRFRIPKEVAEAEGLRRGDNVRVECRKDWFGTLPGLGPFNKKTDRFRSRFEDE